MKTISDAAMAAIEDGTAIVTGAVDIIPRIPLGTIDFAPFATIDISAVTNASTTLAGGLSAGVTLTGFDPTDVVRFTLPPGQTYTAWNWQHGWVNEFDVIRDGNSAGSVRVSESGVTPSNIGHGGGYGTAAAARDAFGAQTLTGASDYTFFIFDSPTSDNQGGLSIAVERGVVTDGDDPAPPLRVWGGYGPLTIEGEVYQGLGDRALAQQNAGAIGGVAQGMTLSLSGIALEVLALFDDAEAFRAASVITYRLIFAGDGKTLLDAHVFDRGRIDTIGSEETVGGSAAIVAAIESAARGLGRSGVRQRSDADQRLIDPNDSYFKSTAYAGQKQLYWGGKRPSTVTG